MSFRQQGSNNGGQMYPGDGSFRQPGARPQFQNSPRYPQRSPQSQPYFTPPHNPGYASPYYRTPNNSSPYTSTPDHMRRQAPRSRDNSPRFSQRGPHRHSRFSPHTRFQSPRSDCNPGGSDDIQQYYHPDMLKDPWANLKPVPVSTPSS